MVGPTRVPPKSLKIYFAKAMGGKSMVNPVRRVPVNMRFAKLKPLRVPGTPKNPALIRRFTAAGRAQRAEYVNYKKTMKVNRVRRAIMTGERLVSNPRDSALVDSQVQRVMNPTVTRRILKNLIPVIGKADKRYAKAVKKEVKRRRSTAKKILKLRREASISDWKAYRFRERAKKVLAKHKEY